MRRINESTISEKQIRALRAEALQAGDLAQVDICDLALQSRQNGTAEAGATQHLRLCAVAINHAAAQ